MKRLLITLLAMVLLASPALAAERLPLTDPDSPAGQCLSALHEWNWTDAAFCVDADGRPLLSFAEDMAYAAVRVDGGVALCCFEEWEGLWDVLWINDSCPFGVDETGAALQPDWLRAQVDRVSWFVSGGDAAWEYSASAQLYSEWLVDTRVDYARTAVGWQEVARTEEPLALLHVFSLHQEGEQEPVVIEGNTLVHYPESRTDAHYIVPDGIEVIGEYAFSDNYNVVHVTLPESVRVIEDDAFAYCENLRIVDMPSTLDYLGRSAFECTWLESITIPEGLTEIGRTAFCASGVGGTIVIPEGVTDIGYDCFTFGYNITDMYLPASLTTIGGMTFREGAEFWEMWAFNSVDEGETHMTVHAPAGTDAALFAQWSGEPYVIEDAREGTDLSAVTGWVQSVLDIEFPGAVVVENHYGFPLVTYGADTVFAFAVLETPGPRLNGFEGLLCCFDRDGDTLTLRWVNREIRSQRYRYTWDELDTPIILELRGDDLYLGLRGDEETAVFLTFTGEDFRLTELESCYWVWDTGGPPAFWATLLRIPVTGGQRLQDFDLVTVSPREYVVHGVIFEEDNVLLSMYDVITASGLDYTSENYTERLYKFEIGDITYELNMQAMTLVNLAQPEINLIRPAPGADDFRSEIIDGRWMVDANTVYCTFRSFLDWPITISIDRETETVTILAQ